MAELNVSSAKVSGRQLNRLPIRVDLTALVDLAFLLITFFMLTITLSRNRAMPLAMPAPGPSGNVPASSTMTICIGKNDQAVWYMGMPDKPLTKPAVVTCNNMNNTITATAKKVLQQTGKQMFVIIKPSQHSVYSSLVTTLDNMSVTNTSSYAIAKISPKDIEMLKQQNLF